MSNSITAIVKLTRVHSTVHTLEVCSILLQIKTPRLVQVVTPRHKYIVGETVLFWDDGVEKEGKIVKSRNVYGEFSGGEVEKITDGTEVPIPTDKWGFQHPLTNQFLVDGSKPGGKAFITAVKK